MRKRGFLVLGAGLLMAVACGEAATNPPEAVEQSNTTTPTLPDGAPNPNFDPATVPPILPDGAPNPIFDASLPDGAVLPGFDAGRTDAGRDGSTPPADAGRDSSTPPPVDAGNPGTPGVVSLNGIAAWDALPTAEKNKVKTSFRSVFIHQSVGGDLEDGAEFNGFKFEFYQVVSGTALPITSNGLNGGLTVASNGDGPGKINDLQRIALANKAILRVAILKFGYADIVAGTLAAAQTAYLNSVNTIKAQGVRVLHVTPPFVYNVPAENAPKMAMRTWMMSTFPNDVIFDLEDVESTEPVGGARCQRGGSWEICNSIRSTSGCPSKNQGVDSASGQGHICETQARRISKSFLYAIYQAGK